MTERQDFDEDPQLRALLGQADPARSLTPADPEGLARLLEDTMNDTTDTSGDTAGATSTRRGPVTWLAGAAAAVLLVGGGFAFASQLRDDEPSVDMAGDATTPTTAAATTAPVVMTLQAPSMGAKCAAPTPELLSQFDTAFEGTVTSVDGDVVTLAPTEVFAGEKADEVEVVGSGIDPRALGGVVTFEVGQTYYVSASDGQVSACGFSGSASDESLQQLYDVAFG